MENLLKKFLLSTQRTLFLQISAVLTAQPHPDTFTLMMAKNENKLDARSVLLYFSLTLAVKLKLNSTARIVLTLYSFGNNARMFLSTNATMINVVFF